MAAERVNDRSSIVYPSDVEAPDGKPLVPGLLHQPEIRGLPPEPSLRELPPERGLRDEWELPESTEFAPSMDGVTDEFAALLGSPSIDTELSHELAPQVSDFAVLHPQRFQPALDGAFEVLSELATGNQRSAPIFLEASKVLEEERSLRELLFLNRHALHQA
jgi:type III secretion system YscX-like protein